MVQERPPSSPIIYYNVGLFSFKISNSSNNIIFVTLSALIFLCHLQLSIPLLLESIFFLSQEKQKQKNATEVEVSRIIKSGTNISKLTSPPVTTTSVSQVLFTQPIFC